MRKTVEVVLPSGVRLSYQPFPARREDFSQEPEIRPEAREKISWTGKPLKAPREKTAPVFAAGK